MGAQNDFSIRNPVIAPAIGGAKRDILDRLPIGVRP